MCKTSNKVFVNKKATNKKAVNKSRLVVGEVGVAYGARRIGMYCLN